MAENLIEKKTIILSRDDFKSSLEWNWVLISIGIPREEFLKYSEVTITSNEIEVS